MCFPKTGRDLGITDIHKLTSCLTLMIKLRLLYSLQVHDLRDQWLYLLVPLQRVTQPLLQADDLVLQPLVERLHVVQAARFYAQALVLAAGKEATDL